jgi:hypothetical protein
MFFPGSRYANLDTYTVRLSDGSTTPVTKLPSPRSPLVLGYRRRGTEERLDHIAARFLADPTAFWRICDANGALSPDSLAACDLVGAPIDALRGG